MSLEAAKRICQMFLPSKVKLRRKKILISNYVIILVFITVIILLEIRNKERGIQKEHFEKLKDDKLPGPKVDWHNYAKMRLEKKRKGPGEQGKPGDISNIPKDLLDKLYKENGYNGALSDLISIDRALPDTRPPNCTKFLYKRDLPKASVIIPFHNEHLSVLLRTAMSVYRRSPKALLKDIVLVDDCSTKELLKDELENFLKKSIPVAKLVRFTERRGLIIARQEGARAAKGDVLIFLDAHCEANVNWLPPLLEIISDDYRTCVCPFIDVIDYDTYKYIGAVGGRGGFDWNLEYSIFYKFKKYGPLSTEPFASPVMAGGLFAISTKFYWELGGYDEGLYIWGGEQFEISFKIWQCGGKILDVPCSRVGHMYRKFEAFVNPNNSTDYMCTNFRRVAEVWMDEYKEYFNTRQPDCMRIPYGDISKQLAIREKLKCKPFKWFMEEVAYDVPNRFPLIDPPNIAYGQIQNMEYPKYCVEITDTEIKLSLCILEQWSQIIQFTWRGEMKKEYSENCCDVNTGDSEIVLRNCHYGADNQLWTYDEETMAIKYGNGQNCLDMDDEILKIFVGPCDHNTKTQKWKLEDFNKDQQDKIPEYLKIIVIDEK